MNRTLQISGFFLDKNNNNPKIGNIYYILNNKTRKRLFIEPEKGFFSLKLKTLEFLTRGNLTIFMRNNSLYEDFYQEINTNSPLENKNITLLRKKISILIKGFIYDYDENKGLSHANISITNISNNVRSQEEGYYEMLLYSEAWVKNTLEFIVSKENYQNRSIEFKSAKFLRNSSYNLDFYLKKTLLSINLLISITVSNTTSSYFEKTLLEIFALAYKIKKKSLIFFNNATIDLKFSVKASNFTSFQVFIRANDYYMSQSLNISINSSNISLILEPLPYNSSAKKARIWGIFPRESRFYYSCSIENSNIAKTLKNGSFNLRFLVDKSQKYLCLLSFEGYSKPFVIEINEILGFSKDLGFLTPQKGLKIVTFEIKALELLRKRGIFQVFFKVFEENPNKTLIIANKSFDSGSGGLFPETYIEEIALKMKTLYRVSFILIENQDILYNISRFLTKLPNKIVFLELLAYDSLRNLSILMNISNNSSIKASGILYYSFSRTFIGCFQVFNGFSILNFTINYLKSQFLGTFLLINSSDFKDSILRMNISNNNNNNEVFLDFDFILLKMKPRIRLLNQIVRIYDKTELLEIKSRVSIEILLMENFLMENRTFRYNFKNSFGTFLFSFKIPIISLQNLNISAIIINEAYYPITQSLNSSNTITDIWLERKASSLILLGKVLDLLNFTREIGNFSLKVSYIDNSSSSYFLNSSKTGFLILSDDFLTNSRINISIILQAKSFKTLRKSLIFIIKNETFDFLKTQEFFLIPKKVKSLISGQITQFNKTTLNYSLIPYNISSFDSKPHNSSLIIPNNSLQMALNTSIFSLKFIIDPTKSPYFLFLLFQNPRFQNLSLIIPLTYTDEFRVSLPKIKLKALPALNISIIAAFYDEQMTILTPLTGIRILLKLKDSESETTIFHRKYFENSTDGIFIQEVLILSSYISIGKDYIMTLYAKKRSFQSYNISQEFEVSNSFNILLNFSSIFLNHKEKAAFVAGILFDNMTNNSFLADKTVYASFTCSNTGDLSMVQINTDSNGSFNISTEVFEGFSYSVIIQITIDDFEDYKASLYLNISNNYNLDLGFIGMLRKRLNATINGVLKDQITGKGLIGYYILLENRVLGNISCESGTLGNFSLSFQVFSGLNYNMTLIYPLEANISIRISKNSSTNIYNDNSPHIRSFLNHKTSLYSHKNIIEIENPDPSDINQTITIYPINNLTNITLMKSNEYSISLGNLLCLRNNISSSINAQFSGNFSGISYLPIVLNFTSGSISLHFLQNLTIDNDFLITFEFSQFIPIALNYSCSLSIISEYLDLEYPIVFLLNTENLYTIDLGLSNLTATTMKFIIEGQILDSSQNTPVSNASVTFSIDLTDNNTLEFRNYGVSDNNGNFSLTIKIPYDLIKGIENSIDNSFEIEALVQISKLFYESQEINFTIDSLDFNRTSSNKMTYILDLGTISLVPDFIIGLVSGFLLDVVLNEGLSGQTLTISIKENDASLISINQLTTDENGSFSLTASLEKGLEYTVNIIASLDSSEFESFSGDFPLNVDNDYRLEELELFVIRKDGDLNIEGVIIDNSTRKIIDECLVIIIISFNRNSSCLNNMSDCEDFTLLLDNISYYSNISLDNETSGVISLIYNNFTDDSGYLLAKMRLWLGISYNISLIFSKEPFILTFYNKSLTLSDDYSLNLGLFTLNRYRISGYISGYILDSLFSMGLSNTSLYFKITHNEIADFLIENVTNSKKNGFFEIKIEGLLAGLNFSLNLQAKRRYFSDFNETDIKFPYYREKKDLELIRNVSLIRKSCDFTIIGTLISKLTNSSISNAKIQGNYSFLNENNSLSETSSDKKGGFMMKINGFQGFLYNLTLEILPETPFINKSIIFSIFLKNSTQERVFQMILLKTLRSGFSNFRTFIR